MNTGPAGERLLPGTWRHVLDRVLEAMELAIATAEAREASLQPGEQLDGSENAWEASLTGLDEQLRATEARATGTGERAAQADEALAGTAEALRQWLVTAAAVRQRLEEVARRAV